MFVSETLLPNINCLFIVSRSQMRLRPNGVHVQISIWEKSSIYLLKLRVVLHKRIFSSRQSPVSCKTISYTDGLRVYLL